MKIVFALLLSGFVLAQDGALNGPTSGYVFESQSKALRPMRGVPGSAYLGNALAEEVDNASASADGRLAAIARNGAVELIVGFDSENPSRVELAREAGNVLLTWSGHDLAVIFTASRQGRLWRGLDQSTSNVASFSLKGLDGEIRHAALSHDTLVVAADGGVYATRNGETRRLAAVAHPSGLAISGNDLFVADQTAGLVLQVSNFAGDDATVETVANVGNPVGLQISGGHLLVASAQTRSVEAFDRKTRNRVASVELDFAPSRMTPLGARGLALLNDGSETEPLFVLDANRDLNVFFVPAGRNQ